MAAPSLPPAPLDTALAQSDGKPAPTWGRWLQQLQAILNGMAVPTAWANVQGGVGFQNSWTDYDGGASWAQASYMRDAARFVHVRGHVKGGGNTTVFTLPLGFRPAKNEQFGGMFNNVWCLVTVHMDGTVDVSQATGTAPFASLAGITFQAAPV